MASIKKSGKQALKELLEFLTTDGCGDLHLSLSDFDKNEHTTVTLSSHNDQDFLLMRRKVKNVLVAEKFFRI